MATIQSFKGHQFPRSSDPKLLQAYNNWNYQYASSSHQIDHDMNPALIVQPTNDEDIIAAIQYARTNKIAVAVKSGGHQYSGACSTSGQNIQIDLKATFRDPKTDLVVLQSSDDGLTYVRVSVSWCLGEFNGFLAQNHCFIPHGQCTDVHLGGHGQTGGYGQLGRSFGLFGDHIRSIRLIDHEAKIQEISKASNPDLFNSILGGSPGNFGVITHYTIQVHQDAHVDFTSVGGDRPHGMRLFWFYDRKVVEELAVKVAEMADNPDFPRNYDLCFSVLSSDFPLLHLIPELDGVMKQSHPEIYGYDGMPKWPAAVVLYAQWIPMSKDDKYDPSWFDAFKHMGCPIHYSDYYGFDKPMPMSEITGKWIFRDIREFDHPYVKRTWLTKSTSLNKDGWPKVVAAQIDKNVAFSTTELWAECWLSCQIQCFGGKNSMFTRNADNGTSYSWRDSTVVQVLDCFHTSGSENVANKWQAENDQLFVGRDSCYSKDDRRVLWGSYGEYDLHSVRLTYYEDDAKYEKLQKVRAIADPEGTFTPNPFCVRSAGK